MYFLYRHIRLDKNEPFYIGIGTVYEKRTTFNSKYLRAFLRSRRSIFWKNIIQKTNYEVEILMESEDFNFIKQKEIEFIRLYGRKDITTGSLVNHTNGGEGNQGYVFSEESKKKLSIARQNNNHLRFGKKVYQLDENKDLVQIWKSIKDAADSISVDKSMLSKVMKREKTFYKNYHWLTELN